MAAARKLARHVTIEGTTYGPDDEVPPEVAEKIRNPKAWVDVEGEVPAPKTSGKGGTSTGARLAGAVTVDGTTYTPDDHIPDEVAEKIRNPKAWEGGRLPGARKAAAKKAPAKQAPAPTGDGAGDGDPTRRGAARPAPGTTEPPTGPGGGPATAGDGGPEPKPSG